MKGQGCYRRPRQGLAGQGLLHSRPFWGGNVGRFARGANTPPFAKCAKDGAPEFVGLVATTTAVVRRWRMDELCECSGGDWEGF